MHLVVAGENEWRGQSFGADQGFASERTRKQDTAAEPRKKESHQRVDHVREISDNSDRSETLEQRCWSARIAGM